MQLFIYAYKMQINISASQTTFRCVFSRQLPGLILLHFNDEVSSNAHEKIQPQVILAHFDAHIGTMQAKVDAHEQKAQQKIKQDCARNVFETSPYKPSEYSFFN